MKHILSLLCSLALLASLADLAAAAEAPVPADIDPIVYERILSTGQYADPNMDGVMTEAELRATDRLTIDMDGVQDLSWLRYMESCKLLSLHGGTITDYSPVKDMPALKTLQMYSVPVTDISFAEGMDLEEFRIIDMPQISLDQRRAIAHWDADLTVEQGFAEIFRVTPSGIFGDPLECSLVIDDISVARIVNGHHASMFDGANIFGVAPGTTSYQLLDSEGQEVYTGTITVAPSTPYDPPLGEGTCTSERYSSNYYGGTVVLREGKLYGFSGQAPTVLEEDVKAYASGYRYTSTRGIYRYFDAVVKNDGTLLLNKAPVPGIDAADIQNECVITKDGALYGLYPNGREIKPVKIADDFAAFSYTEDDFYINKNGEVIGYAVTLTDDVPSVTLYPTGIMGPTSMHYNLFVDKDGVLWHTSLRYGELQSIKVAEGVKEVGYWSTEGKHAEEYLYLAADGQYHTVYGDDQVMTPVPDDPAYFGFLNYGTTTLSAYKNSETGDDGKITYILGADRTLTLDRAGQHAAITHVEKTMLFRYDKDAAEGYAYCFRTDGSIWRYCFERDVFEEIMPAEGTAAPVSTPGDVDADGTCAVADVIALQKWLHAVPGASLKDAKAADLDGDGRVDIFDLARLKRMLLAGKA